MTILDLLNKPEVEQYLHVYGEGESLFVEGDDSKDLYILVDGRLSIFKDKKQITVINTPGDLVGEMSYLLDSGRTATVTAQTEVKALRIPKDDINDFIRKHQDVTPQIIHNLAQRLKETTQIVHGLHEFCDQLPDAVVMTDTNHKILAWNNAAESLHGRTWQEMKGHQVSEVFQNPEEYKEFIDDIKSGRHLSEKVIAIKLPSGDTRYVSTSTNILHDGHFNIAGYIFLSRNVTKIKDMEKKYNRIRNWLIPASLMIVLLLVLLFGGLSSFSKGKKILDHKKESFISKILQDSNTLTVSLTPFIRLNDQQSTTNVIRQYFYNSSPQQFGITGILVLNHAKIVEVAYCPIKDGPIPELFGSNYSGIPFQGSAATAFRVLNLYRADSENPMGVKKTEIAFAITGSSGLIDNWIVFQLNDNFLNKEFGITSKMLTNLNFEINK